MVRRKNVLKVWAKGFLKILMVMMLISAMVFAIIWSRNEWGRLSRELPKLEIQLSDTTLDEVHDQGKRTKYEGNELSITWMAETENFLDVQFKGHGNTAWEADKKSYRIKLTRKTDLLGLGKAKKWVLIANYDDDSLMRNDIGLYISRLVSGSPINGKFVKLNINDEELGVYYLTKALDIGKDVIYLTDSYGVLAEYDSAYGVGEEYYYRTERGGLLTVKDVVADDNAEIALENFGTDFDKLEKAAVKHDYEKVKDLIDVESFADYFVISEFTGNPDAYLTSFYMYKDGPEDLIHAGIGWDFDAAFGNRNWGSGKGEFYLPTTMMARRERAFSDNDIKMTLLFYHLIEIPEFYELVCNTYQEKLMGQRVQVLKRISEMADMIHDEAILNNEKWQQGDFDEEVKYLSWWVETRFNVFDENYGGAIKMPTIIEGEK